MLCSHSEATKSIKMYKRDGSLEQLEIKKRITCTDENFVYIISCTKQNGPCAKVYPQFVGEDHKVEVCQTMRRSRSRSQEEPSQLVSFCQLQKKKNLFLFLFSLFLPPVLHKFSVTLTPPHLFCFTLHIHDLYTQLGMRHFVLCLLLVKIIFSVMFYPIFFVIPMVNSVQCLEIKYFKTFLHHNAHLFLVF